MSDAARNKEGLTLEQFLANYDATIYERPSVTVDTFMMYLRPSTNGNSLDWMICLINRKDHPSIGKWALPGGFVQMDETTDVAAQRETMEETGITPTSVEEFAVFSDPKRDPRTRVITVAYFAFFVDFINPIAGDDAAFAKWFKLSSQVLNTTDHSCVVEFILKNEDIELTFKANFDRSLSLYRPVVTIISEHQLAADHATIIATAWYQLTHEYWRQDRYKSLSSPLISVDFIDRFMRNCLCWGKV